MATSDVTFQDGLKHPYLLALVRWCLSSVWSTATVLLHRLVAAPVPQVKGPKQPKSRPASYDHLHPEPRVDCEVLYSPEKKEHTLDVIFVHGLYGSLGNTWRQGEWQTKYDKSPKKVPLRRPHCIPTCKCTDERTIRCADDDNNGKNDKSDGKHTKGDIDNEVQHRKTGENNDFLSKNEINVNIVNNNNVKGDNDRIKQCNCDKNIDFNEKDVHNHKTNEIGKTKQTKLNDNMDIRKSEYSNEKNGRTFKCDANRTSNGELLVDRVYVNENSIDFNTQNSKNNVNVEKYESKSAMKAAYVQNEDKTRQNYEINDNNIKKYEDIQKILPNENLFITEKFYNNTLLDDISGAMSRYETQAQFVKDLYESSVREQSEVRASDCKCQTPCEVGCGCICDDCYSPCWPRDWVREDHPGARVISINYTSDPYLWRPLWVKESKRLRLHERAEQMMSQLLDLGVGERPIIWVGHSKGGLFIKKMYCEAYEAHLKLTKENAKEETSEHTDEQNTSEFRNDNEINHCRDKRTDENNLNVTSVIKNDINVNTDVKYDRANDINDNNLEDFRRGMNLNDVNKLNNEMTELNNTNEDLRNEDTDETNVYIYRAFKFNGLHDTGFNELNDHIHNINQRITKDGERKNNNNFSEMENEVNSDNNEERISKEFDSNGNISEGDKDIKESLLNMDEVQWSRRAGLWRNSAGFMFYSVPHRGSPLADIKTPITARSIELMEICKDCPLVLSLQARWRAATAPAAPAVRSVVETCRTLMSVLYLRIVSVDSADPGIGSLYGVDVDHREICKPSSRRCLLYRELMTLMETALSRRCEEHVKKTVNTQ